MRTDHAPASVRHVGGDEGAEEEALRADEGPHGQLAMVEAEAAELVGVGGRTVMLQREAVDAIHGDQGAHYYDGYAQEGAGGSQAEADRGDGRPEGRRRHVQAMYLRRWRQGGRLSPLTVAVFLAPEGVTAVHRWNGVEVVGWWRR